MGQRSSGGVKIDTSEFENKSATEWLRTEPGLLEGGVIIMG